MNPFDTLPHDYFESAMDSGESSPVAPMLNRRRRNAFNSPPNDGEAASARDTVMQGMVESLEENVPVNFAPMELRRFINEHSNLRLHEAAVAGIELKDITIGFDCLPTWPNRAWDPNAEPLHQVLQRELAAREVSEEIGNLLQMDIIRKGNRMLERFVAMGKTLADVKYGEKLIPELISETEDTDVVMADDDSSSASGYVSAPEEAGPVVEETLAAAFPDTIYDSDSSSSVVEAIEMLNLNQPTPIFTEHPDEWANVINPATLFGGDDDDPDAVSVDLEVYVAEDDDDALLELPAAELAVDGEAWDHHHGAQAAVGVELVVEGDFVLINEEEEGVFEMEL